MEIVEGEATHVVNIPVLLAKMEDRLSKSHPSTVTNEKRCIFRLPSRFNNINGKSFEPQVVALGPYHHGKPRLQMMEELKWRCLTYFMQSIKGKLEECLIQLVPLVEKEVRECYSETIDFNTDELLQMMVVDGFFILMLIGDLEPYLIEQNGDNCNPLQVLEKVTIFKIFQDLLLLENQIPSFVLEKLYQFCIRNDMPLFVVAKTFFQFISVFSFSRKGLDPPKWLHLLDLVRSLLISRAHNEEMPITYEPFGTIPCVTKLRRAGIKVNRRMTDSFLDMKFRNGVIEMPDITLDDSMCLLLVNCVAYEQLCNISKHFSIYTTLLDDLVNTAKDIDYLCDRRVIDNCFRTDTEAAQFINNLGKDLILQKDGDYHNFFLSDFFRDVNKCYRRRLNWDKWTSFKREYFGKPWLLISALVGFVLLVLTFLQTYYTIYAYEHPKK